MPHAGELGGPDAIRDALDLLHADRLRHGIRAIEDPDLVQELGERGTVLDVCPVSNVRVGVVPTLEEHPLPQLVAAGVLCSLSTDDPPMFDTDLTAEYEAAACSLGLDPRAFYEAGIAGALCDERTRAGLVAIGEAYDWDQLELDGRAGGARLAQPRLLVERRHRPLVERIRLLRALVDRRQPRAAVLAERAHHVEDDAGLPRLVEVEARAHREVEQVVGRQRPIDRALDVIGGDEELLLAARRREQPRSRRRSCRR